MTGVQTCALPICKTAPVDPDADTSSRKAFLARLKALGHYETQYEIVDKLLLHFWQQLDKLAANGFIRFPKLVEKVDIEKFKTETVGIFTLTDIKEELTNQAAILVRNSPSPNFVTT